MLNREIDEIVRNYKNAGWIPEPEAKRLFNTAGLKVPLYKWARTQNEAIESAKEIKYPLVAKIVSSVVIHKSDVGGVIVGIGSNEELKKAYHYLSKLDGFEGVLLEEMVSGHELIIGAKVDYQFGPVVLLGIGGTGVEIYSDVTMRMAPLEKTDVISMIDSLKGRNIIKGYRGSDPVNISALTDMIINFSALIMQLEDNIESIDLNPVICSKDECVIADARIMLKR